MVEGQEKFLNEALDGLEFLETALEQRLWEVSFEEIAESTFGGNIDEAKRAVGLFNAYCARCHTAGYSAGVAYTKKIGSGGLGPALRGGRGWGAHLMVLVVFLHMSRVFYHGAYKAPREFNWVIGVILLFLTLFLSFTGYLLPWDQLAIWAVTVGGNMASYTPVFGAQIKFGLFAGLEATTATLLRFYVLHVLFFPFIIVIFMAIHFWRVRKDGGISGPL